MDKQNAIYSIHWNIYYPAIKKEQNIDTCYTRDAP